MYPEVTVKMVGEGLAPPETTDKTNEFAVDFCFYNPFGAFFYNTFCGHLYYNYVLSRRLFVKKAAFFIFIKNLHFYLTSFLPIIRYICYNSIYIKYN